MYRFSSRLLLCIMHSCLLVLSLRKYVDMNSRDVIDELISINSGDDVSKIFHESLDRHPSISVILASYKRNYTLEQLQAVLSQSILVEKIYIYQNENHVNLEYLDNFIQKLCYDGDQESGGCYMNGQWIPKVIVLHNKQENFRYHGRFSVPLLLDTTYVAIFDDDIIPGEYYIENCKRVTEQFHAVCGAAGQILAPNRKIMAFPPVDDDLEVDSVGWSWFARVDWMKYMWSDSMPTFSQAEDISFGMSLWKNARIRSFVVRQPADDRRYWGSVTHYGDDDHASYKTSCAGMMRWAVNMYWIQRGFIPLAVRQVGGSCIEVY